MRVGEVADALGVVYDDDWRDGARCKSAGASVFYACEKMRPGSVNWRMAVARANGICDRCPVEVSCRVWAVAHPKELGVWGGTTTEERDAIRRRMRRLRVRSAGYGEHESLETV